MNKTKEILSQTVVLKKNYSNIIQQTVNRIPENYEEIRFDKFINIEFPNSNAFISSDIIGEIRTFLKHKYNNDSHCIKEFGILTTLNLNELKFYQTTVGINGPKHTSINEPVYVINHDGKMILFNGYHRIIFHLLDNRMTVDAFVLTIKSNLHDCKH